MIRILILLVCVFSFTEIFAQKGVVRGSVFDGTTGEALYGVTVQLEGTGTGTITDFDGKFELKLDPGTYNLLVSYISYKSITILETSVASDKVTILENIKLVEDVAQLEEVVVTASALKTSEEALLTVKMKSSNLLDGISSANFRKIGDSDAASAVNRVPGVSVEGGKYVYVRGLGDRYTKSTLNSMDIPGLDPDRNTVQMDMFSTNLLDNIVVLKSFTADLPGDFTGGIVNIETKEFPEEKTLNVSASIGYNPSMHFNDDYLTYQGGKTDFLGFDDGTRAIPTDRSTSIPLYGQVVGKPDSEKGQEFQSILKSFNPHMAAMKEKSLMDYKLGVNFGNQFGNDKNTFGYTLALSYANTTEFYQDAQFSRYGKSNSSIYELDQREVSMGDYGVNNVSLSGIVGLAWKRSHSKYKINFFHTQNGESKAGIFELNKTDLGTNLTAKQDNLEYSERALTNLLIGGSHHFGDNTWQVDWNISPTRSSIEDPDIRITRYRIDGPLTIGSESGYPERIWRYLNEENLMGKLDLTKNYSFLTRDAKVKFGGAYTFKERDYEIQGFQIIPQGVTLTGNPDELFYESNLWPMDVNGTKGTRYEPQFIPSNPNKYNSYVRNFAGYVSTDFSITEKLKTIVGVRIEDFTQFYTGVNRQGLEYDNQMVIDDLGIFPSVNFVYALNERRNLRLSYSQTIARPSFKEASFAEIRDPLTGRTFVGGFFQDVDDQGNVIWDGNLTSSTINNFDLRWETFMSKGQTLAISAFYKTFDRPIEMVQYVQAANNFQPRNVGDGSVLGIEFEVRKNLDFISEFMGNFSVNSNITFTRSQIEMSPTEYNSRVTNARDGETIKSTRDMAGQSPYIINAGISYQGDDNGLDIGLFYNVQGRTLTFVGIADRPDVYARPFNSLNFNALKSFGADERMQIGFSVTNILNSKKMQMFESYKATDQIFTSLQPGTSMSLKFGYKF